MDVAQGTGRSLKVLAVTLVPIIGVAVAGFIFFTMSQRAYLVERDYRALLIIAQQAQDRLDGLREALGTEHRSRDPSCRAKDGLPSSTTSRGDAPLREVPWIKKVARAKVTTSPSSERGTRIGIVAAPDGRSLEAFVAYEARCDELCETVTAPQCRAPATHCATTSPSGPGAFTTCSRIPLGRILADVSPYAEQFDAVAISIGDQVVVVRNSAGGDVTGDLQRELHGTVTTADHPATDADVARAEKQLEARPIPWFMMRGERFLRFSLPIAVPATTLASNGKPVAAPVQVHGLLRDATLRHEQRRVSDGWILGLLLVLVFAVLAWPLLKLWYMGPLERLNGLDVRVLALSMLLASGMIAFGIREIARHKAMSESFDRQLKAFAKTVSDALITDINEARAVARSAAVSRGDSTLERYWDFERVVVIGPAPEARAVLAWEAQSSDNSNVWTLHKADVPNLRVSDRQYYIDIGARRSQKAGDEVFTAEVVRSKVSGNPTLVVATRLDETNPTKFAEAPDATAVVVAMRATRFLHSVLPYGFGFAVLDPTGRVVLHSDRVLVDNVIDECDDDARLRAALRAPGHRPLDVSCSGAFFRVVAWPVELVPSWTLVAFRDVQLLDKVNDEIAASWAFLYLLYVAGLVGALLITQIVHEGYRAEWVWPDRRFPTLYRAAIIQLLATAVVSYGALQAQAGFARLGFLFATMAATTGALALALDAARSWRVVLRPWERRIAVTMVALGGLAMLARAVMVDDAPTVAALLALAALWWPVAPSPHVTVRPSQVAAVLAVAIYAAYTIVDGTWATWARYLVALGIATILAFALPREAIVTRMSWLAQLRTRLCTRVRRARLWQYVAARPWVRTSLAAVRSDQPSEGRFRFEYVSMLFALLVVGAIVPALALYRDARLQATTELLRFGQSRMHDAEKAVLDGVQPVARQVRHASDAVFRVGWTCWNDESLLGCDANEGAARRSLASFALSRLPTFGTPTPELRALGDDGKAEGDAASSCRGVEAYLPHLRRRWWLLCIGLACGAAVVVFSVLWSIVRLVFLLDIDRFDEVGPASVTPHGTLNAWTFGTRAGIEAITKSSPPVRVVDLRIPTTEADLKAISDDETATIIEVDHPEAAFDDDKLHPALLLFLERLVHDPAKSVILIAEVDPVHWAATRALEAADDCAAATSGNAAVVAAVVAAKEKVEADARTLLARWSQLLGAFTRTCWQLPASSTLTQEQREVAKVLATKYPSLSPDVEHQANTADAIDEARHWQIWRQCTRAEKLTLRQLAEQGFLNPNAAGVTRRLCDRLLIRRDPAFSLVTRAFARFVLRAETRETIATWEAAGAKSMWARLRGPLMMMAVIAVTYLIVAEPGALNWTIAIATGVAAALPAILKLFSMFGEQRYGAGGR